MTRDYPGRRALDRVSFSLAAGTVTALVGPNGAGKTTLMRCLAALDPPFAGRVLVDGLDAAERPRDVHQRTGFLQDFFGLYDTLTVAQGLWYAAAARAVPESEIAARMAWAAAAVDLSDRMNQRAGTLSRGLRQRLAIAQTIVHRPRMVLLDEPASGLDPESRMHLARLLTDLRTAHGMTLLVSSHILAELEDYCTHVLILRDGRLVRHDALADAASAAPERADRPPGRVTVSFSDAVPDAARRLGALPGVASVEAGPAPDRAIMTLTPATAGREADQRAALLRALIDQGLPVCGFAPLQRNLTDVYRDHLRQPNGAGTPADGPGGVA
nr:ABC transporter ATP-binding protein [Roseospira goensis]